MVPSTVQSIRSAIVAGRYVNAVMGAGGAAGCTVVDGSSIDWHIARCEIAAIATVASAMRTVGSAGTGELSVIQKMLQVLLAIALSTAAPSAQQRGVVV